LPFDKIIDESFLPVLLPKFARSHI